MSYLTGERRARGLRVTAAHVTTLPEYGEDDRLTDVMTMLFRQLLVLNHLFIAGLQTVARQRAKTRGHKWRAGTPFGPCIRQTSPLLSRSPLVWSGVWSGLVWSDLVQGLVWPGLQWPPLRSADKSAPRTALLTARCDFVRRLGTALDPPAPPPPPPPPQSRGGVVKRYLTVDLSMPARIPRT